MKVNLVLVIIGILIAVLGAIFLYLNTSGKFDFYKGDVWYYVSGLMLILGIVMAVGAVLIGANDADVSINSPSMPTSGFGQQSMSKPNEFNITFSSAPPNVSSDANISLIPTRMPGEAIITNQSVPGMAGLGFNPAKLGFGTVGLH